ncbi:Protein FAM47E [Bagarius yarrelli]|uniref:Protein FAM47E n=1 Tax=Bagarius yarrelli TaxID=175774 RepID=A0A556U5E6_BAGYA|nr:Protein FAM47E [Bagarius yarrelli]
MLRHRFDQLKLKSWSAGGGPEHLLYTEKAVMQKPRMGRYKERLRTKCLKDPVQRLQLAGALNGRRWRFLTAGLDDFRDGYPIPQAGTFTLPQRGTEAAIFGLSHKPESERTSRRHFTKEQACFSKQNCLRQSRRRFVDAVEQSLRTHPLAIYPHLGSGMEPELFYEVLSVLDPALNVRIETPLAKQGECSKGDVEQFECLQETLAEKTTERPDSLNFGLEEVKNPSWNPYKLKESKEIFGKEDQKISNKSSLDEEINRVTKLFCDWVTSLGGETNDITESTILNLFASGSEKNPVLTFQDFGTDEQPEEMCGDHSPNLQLKDSVLNKAYTPSKKSTYGAWYLHPKTWKKRPKNEPLRDPSVTEDCEFEQQLNEKDEELKLIYGTQAFKEFIVSKGFRVPRFLSSLLLDEEQENRIKVTNAKASASTPSGSAMI